jgi:hypothetical protein
MQPTKKYILNFKLPMKKIFNTLLVIFLFVIPVAAQQEIKLMSYNIRLDVKSDGENQWDKRKDRVAGLMKYYEADFIGGQEVTHPQKKYLEEQLEAYSSIGVGRDDGEASAVFGGVRGGAGCGECGGGVPAFEEWGVVVDGAADSDFVASGCGYGVGDDFADRFASEDH